MIPPRDTYIDALLTKISELEAQNEALRNALLVKQEIKLVTMSTIIESLKLVNEL